MEQPFEQVGQRDDRQSDARSEGQDEPPVDLPEPGNAAGEIETEERTQCGAACPYRGDQSLVNAEDEGDRSPGHAGDDVGGTHEETAKERPRNLANHGGECRCGVLYPVYRAL